VRGAKPVSSEMQVLGNSEKGDSDMSRRSERHLCQTRAYSDGRKPTFCDFASLFSTCLAIMVAVSNHLLASSRFDDLGNASLNTAGKTFPFNLPKALYTGVV
jgi:hypothetical protein